MSIKFCLVATAILILLPQSPGDLAINFKEVSSSENLIELSRVAKSLSFAIMICVFSRSAWLTFLREPEVRTSPVAFILGLQMYTLAVAWTLSPTWISGVNTILFGVLASSFSGISSVIVYTDDSIRSPNIISWPTYSPSSWFTSTVSSPTFRSLSTTVSVSFLPSLPSLSITRATYSEPPPFLRNS